jgi:hypothetical protein
MRFKTFVVLMVVLAGFTLPAFADWELGLSWTPVPNALTDGGSRIDYIPGFHAGYAASIFYGSWDVLSVPDFVVEDWTGYSDVETGHFTAGYYESGYLNLLDAGIRLNVKPFIGFAEAGINSLFIHGQGFIPGGFGANLRLGLGVKFGWWGITLTGTSVFASWRDLVDTVHALGSSETHSRAWDAIQSSLVPSILFNWYFR